MTGYCPDCGNTQCICSEIEKENGVVSITYPTPCYDPCSKCGNAPNKLRWVEAGRDLSCTGPARYWDEHIRHTCTCCVYGWDTKPLDQNKNHPDIRINTEQQAKEQG